MKAKPIDIDLLYSILHIESESYQCERMQHFLIEYAKDHSIPWDVDRAGNLYLTKGEGPYPCMVAHMDTVHDIIGGGITVVEIGGLLTGMDSESMTQTGIGGDDKCGIYAALHCLKELDACKVVFFVDEEVGCVGSYDCDLSFFKDCRFVLQADRRGHTDFVTDICGDLSSERFLRDAGPILKDHGYKPCHGMMSDVMALRDLNVGISVANMSAGYYNPHQANEFICLEDLANVCSLMETMAREMTRTYPFKYQRPKVVKPVINGFTPPPAKKEKFPDWPEAAIIDNDKFFSLAGGDEEEAQDSLDQEYYRIMGFEP
jgi:tripeptide aminopeptidase